MNKYNITRKQNLINKKAFTLAEVLITLGIVGVVAAMTLPQLIKGHQKSVVESRLSHFYSMINQAVKMSTIDNGEPEIWTINTGESVTCESNLEFLNHYILPYLKTKNTECMDVYDYTGQILVRLENGSAFTLNRSQGIDIVFLPYGKVLAKSELNRKNFFVFQLMKNAYKNSSVINSKHGIEPYTYMWDGTIENLKSGNKYGCYTGLLGNYCAKLIQLNGWKIPKDYPW